MRRMRLRKNHWSIHWIKIDIFIFFCIHWCFLLLFTWVECSSYIIYNVANCKPVATLCQGKINACFRSQILPNKLLLQSDCFIETAEVLTCRSNRCWYKVERYEFVCLFLLWTIHLLLFTLSEVSSWRKAGLAWGRIS